MPMSINILLNDLAVKSANISKIYHSSSDDELQIILQLVLRANIDCAFSNQISTESAYKIARIWLEKLKQNDIPIQTNCAIKDSKISRAFSSAVLNTIIFPVIRGEIKNCISAIPTFTEEIEEFLEAFVDSIIEAYQTRDFLDYCEVGGEYDN